MEGQGEEVEGKDEVDEVEVTRTHPKLWKREMRNRKDVSIDAYKHLKIIPPR